MKSVLIFFLWLLSALFFSFAIYSQQMGYIMLYTAVLFVTTWLVYQDSRSIPNLSRQPEECSKCGGCYADIGPLMPGTTICTTCINN